MSFLRCTSKSFFFGRGGTLVLNICQYDTCLTCQHKDINEIENRLNEDFCNICDCLVDNKLSIHCGEDKTKPIFFSSKFKRKNTKNLHIKYGDICLEKL